ncbi:unnamed protein product [Rotaria socialis]|uniref:Cadherin domain-containing protein n=2 Tax=Rotaria socialis TaxID=392032 RepID=A0A820DWU6_9BILA|nr:unnamed protein product [Rotaria socialis]CAF4237802.1 unnamed protein product [Rotaria socialis]
MMMMMMMIIYLLSVIIKCSYSNPSIRTYPIVDLLENSPLNTFIIEVTQSTNKLNLLNINRFETKLFSIRNGSIYTKDLIDREEFLDRQYCLNKFYCKIELQILVDDGFAYWIVPIHIVDENDNKPEFAKTEIELRFVESVSNGYKIYFEGARDFDEGKNSEIRYILDCSNSLNDEKNLIFLHFNETSSSCSSLFELIMISKSSLSFSNNFDRLALKFNPLSMKNIENEYKLKIYAIDNNPYGNELINSMNLIVKIEEKGRKFLLSEYEFVVLLNNSINKTEYIIGKIHAISNNPEEIIYYKILSNNKTANEIKINSLTGQLIFLNENKTKIIDDEIEIFVEAFLLLREKKLKKLKTQTKVKLFFRYLNLLNNISLKSDPVLLNNENNIYPLNNDSNTFFLNKNIQRNQNLLKLSLSSFSYPNDKFIISLENYFNTFFLVPSSSSSINSYFLKLNQQLISDYIYLLNIQVKHKLSQHYLPNLNVRLIVFDQLTTTIVTNHNQTFVENNNHTEALRLAVDLNEILNESLEFCLENKSYIIYDMKTYNEVAFLKVVKSNLFISDFDNLTFILTNFFNINQSEIIINGCRMLINQLNDVFNKSFEYQLCSLNDHEGCFNLTFIDQINPISFHSGNHVKKFSLPIKPIEKVMVCISIIFLIVTLILILLICRLNDFDLRSKLKTSFFYGKEYGNKKSKHLSSFSFSQPPSSSSTSSGSSLATAEEAAQRVHSIIIRDSHFSSLRSIEINNDDNEPYLFDIDHFFQREPLPKTNTFIFPTTGPISSSSSSSSSSPSVTLQRQENTISTVDNRLSTPKISSSSFLQETKQLLDMISLNLNYDLSKLTSEV